MIGRRLRLVGVLAAAVGIPYAWYHPEILHSVRQQADAVWQRAAAAQPFGQSDAGAATASIATEPSSLTPQLTGTLVSLEEVLRFDVTPAWLNANWTRVSTVHSHRELEGLRVPYVSGINLDDVAGSLTYYFDRYHRVQRITLHGQTGDANRLAQLVINKFHLRPAPTLGAGMYVARWNNQVRSVLRVTRSPVMSADQPNANLYVDLELNLPNSHYRLSDELYQVLDQDFQSRRW